MSPWKSIRDSFGVSRSPESFSAGKIGRIEVFGRKNRRIGDELLPRLNAVKMLVRGPKVPAALLTIFARSVRVVASGYLSMKSGRIVTVPFLLS